MENKVPKGYELAACEYGSACSICEFGDIDSDCDSIECGNNSQCLKRITIIVDGKVYEAWPEDNEEGICVGCKFYEEPIPCPDDDCDGIIFKLKGEDKMFSNSDLRTGMRVEYRNGNTRIVLLDTDDGDIFCGQGEHMTLRYYNDDLVCPSDHDFDIVRIYGKPINNEILDENEKGKLLWERKEEKTITVKGKEYSEETLHKMIKQYVE